MFFKRLIVPLCLPAASFVSLVSLSGVLNAQAKHAAAPPTGQQIFLKQCAACHGAKGEGTKLYQKPLTGNRSAGELARFISQSMPPGPRKCTGPDAKSVAAYLYDTFYSPLAQARNRPARIALSRLTVRQFRNAATDLVGSFRSGGRPDERRGLRGQYYKSSRMRTADRVLERVDPEIRFDYGAAGPLTEQADPYQFSMRWEGSVLAPDTGEYEFIVHTEHAMSLWVNDIKKPLIDAQVKSGSGSEFRASLFLIAGRAYPLRLDFSKGVTGVDNIAKVKLKPPVKASITLEWRRPKQAVEVIPNRSLSPVFVSEAFVPETSFPPDDRSIGYERGTSVSKAWDESTTTAALETASYVSARLRELSGVPDGAADRESRIRAFCKQLVERAFRRPLTDDVAQFYVERQFKGARDPETAVKRVVLITLLSPRFLYREIGAAQPDAYDVASRLSFGLWDSLPDQELMKAAASGQLITRDQVVRQAERMAADPRSWTKLREFLLQWLKVDQFPDLAKDTKRFPGFDSTVAADLRTSFELFLEKTVWTDKADYRELLLTDKLYLNGRLAKLYGANLPSDAPFEPVSAGSSARCGVLTQPYILSSFAYIDNSSPIHRGVLIARNMLGRVLQPPPMAFAPLAADLHPNLTTRQRVALQTKPAACNSCHGMINPLGFALERFDAVGRARDVENGQPVDSTGSYTNRAGGVVKFSGPRDLAQYLVGSEEAHAAFVEKLFQHLVKQPVLAYGPRTLPDLVRSFETNQFNIRKLMGEIVAVSSLKR